VDKTQEGGELVLSNKINTLKFFQYLSIKSVINFFKHNNRWNKEIEKKIEHKIEHQLLTSQKRD